MPGTVACDREYITAQRNVHSAADVHLAIDKADDRVVEAGVAPAGEYALSHKRNGDFIGTPSYLPEERCSSRHWTPSRQAVCNPTSCTSMAQIQRATTRRDLPHLGPKCGNEWPDGSSWLRIVPTRQTRLDREFSDRGDHLSRWSK
jgi:hypothetical protein